MEQGSGGGDWRLRPWRSRPWRPALLALLLVAAPPLAAQAQSPTPAPVPAPLDGLLEPVRQRHGLPALAAAVVVRGETVAAGAVGLRRSDAAIPVTLQDRFHIGSDTKAMTALLAAMAVERGQLRWESSLAEVFPELRPAMAPGVGGVTLRQLLSHSSGIGDASMESAAVESLREQGNLDAQRLVLVRRAVAQRLLSPPGSRFRYGNNNYVLAGAMLERVQGRTWEELIQEQLFAPLGLRSAGLGPQSSPGLTDAPLGHREHEGRLLPLLAGPNADNPAVLGPAGVAHMSVLDFARWAGWSAGQGQRGPALVSAQTLRLLHAPVIATDPAAAEGERYGLGWALGRPAWAAAPLLTHQGSNTMNLAQIWVDPDRDLALVLATNTAGPRAQAALEELSPRLHALAAGWPRLRRLSVAPGVNLEVRDWSTLTPADRRDQPPLVLLAGLGNTAAVFDDLAPRLAARRPVLAITRRGFGGSSAPSSGYDVPTRVEDLRRALDGLGLGRVVLVGHSIAGDELTLFAARHPQRLAALVYLDAALNRQGLRTRDPMARCAAELEPLLEQQQRRQGWRLDPDHGGLRPPSTLVASRAAEEQLGAPLPAAEQAVSGQPATAATQRASQALIEADNRYRPDYRPIRAPLLALYGGSDAGSPYRLLRNGGPAEAQASVRRCLALQPALMQRIGPQDLRSQRPDARLIVWPDTGHYLFLEQPQRTVDAIEAFLASPP